MSRFRSLPHSFRYAITGLKVAARNEPNFQVHIFAASVVLAGAALLRFSTIEWLFLLFTTTFVIVLELLNTSIEALVNLVSPEVRPQAKIAKDVSAAMVLIAALMSVSVGVLLFIPKLMPLFP